MYLPAAVLSFLREVVQIQKNPRKHHCFTLFHKIVRNNTIGDHFAQFECVELYTIANHTSSAIFSTKVQLLMQFFLIKYYARSKYLNYICPILWLRMKHYTINTLHNRTLCKKYAIIYLEILFKRVYLKLKNEYLIYLEVW